MNWMVRADFPTPVERRWETGGVSGIDIPSREERWRTTTADDYQLIFSQKLSLHGRKKKGGWATTETRKNQEKRRKKKEDGLTLDIWEKKRREGVRKERNGRCVWYKKG
jgi:hypothetical protein